MEECLWRTQVVNQLHQNRPRLRSSSPIVEGCIVNSLLKIIESCASNDQRSRELKISLSMRRKILNQFPLVVCRLMRRASKLHGIPAPTTESLPFRKNHGILVQVTNLPTTQCPTTNQAISSNAQGRQDWLLSAGCRHVEPKERSVSL